MANASRVSEIFQQASVAFGRLAQLTLDLKLSQAEQTDSEQKSSSKWSSKEIDQLKDAVGRFGNDLGKIAESIQTKTLAQIKQKVKTKTFQDAGMDDVDHSEESAKASSIPIERGRRKQSLVEPENINMHDPKRIRLDDQPENVAPSYTKLEGTNYDDSQSLVSGVPRQPAVVSSLKDGSLFVRGPVRPNNATASSVLKPVLTPKANQSVVQLKQPLDLPSASKQQTIVRFEIPSSSECNYSAAGRMKRDLVLPSSARGSVGSHSRYEEYEDSDEDDEALDDYDSVDYDDEEGAPEADSPQDDDDEDE